MQTQRINRAIDRCFTGKDRNATLQVLWGGFVAFYYGFLNFFVDYQLNGAASYISVWDNLKRLTRRVELASAAPTARDIQAIVLQFEGATVEETQKINDAIGKCFTGRNDNEPLQQLWGGFVAFYNCYIRAFYNNGDYPSAWYDLLRLTRDVEEACSAPTAGHTDIPATLQWAGGSNRGGDPVHQ
ncbi:hypothetical protein ACCS93_39225 [Rhizobium ruizarguesonis]